MCLLKSNPKIEQNTPEEKGASLLEKLTQREIAATSNGFT